MQRRIGSIAVVVLTLFSWVLFHVVVRADAAEPELEAAVDVISSDPDIGIMPEYLAFSDIYPTGEYRVGASAAPTVLSSENELGAEPEDKTRSPLSELSQIPSGLYATEFGVTGCGYELSSLWDDGVERTVGSDSSASGRLIVTIDDAEADRFHSAPGCGDWLAWTPLEKSITIAGNGDYWENDLALGLWQVPRGCVWEKVDSFRGANASDITQSGAGPTALLVDSETLGVRVRGCGVPMSFVSS